MQKQSNQGLIYLRSSSNIVMVTVEGSQGTTPLGKLAASIET